MSVFYFFHKATGTTNFLRSAQAFNTVISLEAFPATKFNEMFMAGQLRQDVKVCRHCREWLHPHLQAFAGGLVEPKPITRCPTLCCVYLCWAWVQDEMWPLWLVGVDKRSLHLVWAVFCWNALESPGQVPWTLDYSHQPDGSQSNLRPGPIDIYTTPGRTPSYQFQFCHTASNTLIMGTESDTVMLDNLHILMLLSAWECFIEFNTVILALQKEYLKIIIPDYITYAHTHWIPHAKLQNANIIFFYSH